MYTLDASLCLPRSWLPRAALLSCKLKLSGSNQSTADNTGLLKIRSYALYPARVYLGVFVLRSGRKELCQGGCHLLCQSWVQYSTFRHWHWYGCMFFFCFFFNSFCLTCMLYWSYSNIPLGKKAYDDKAWTWQISAWNSSPNNKHVKCNLCFDSFKGIHQQCACINSPVLV